MAKHLKGTEELATALNVWSLYAGETIGYGEIICRESLSLGIYSLNRNVLIHEESKQSERGMCWGRRELGQAMV